MSSRNICVTDTPEKKKKVVVLLALANLSNGALIEDLIAVIRSIMFEELLLPVIVPIGLLKEMIVCNIHLLCALNLGLIMSIVDHRMPTSVHHLAEFKCLLSKGAGAIVFAGDSVRNCKNMEPKFGFRRRSVRRTT
jgi:hypothetical protein